MIVAYDGYIYACCCMIVGCGLLALPIVVLAAAIGIDEVIRLFKKVKKK